MHQRKSCHCFMLSDRALSTRGKGKPVDMLDSLCKQYKECVHCAKSEFGEECIPEMVKYKWGVNKKGESVIVSKDDLKPEIKKKSAIGTRKILAKVPCSNAIFNMPLL